MCRATIPTVTPNAHTGSEVLAESPAATLAQGFSGRMDALFKMPSIIRVIIHNNSIIIMAHIPRSHPRYQTTINAALTFLNTDSRIVKTRNLSAAGMFLLLDNPGDFPIGDIVQIHYLDPLNNDADTFKDAIIVRVADDGIAISFVELDEF